MKSKIFKIGMEVEGEFERSLREQLVLLGGAMHGDGSVRRCKHNISFHKKFYDKVLETAEYVTAPVLLEDKKEFKKVFDVLKEGTKDGRFHWNKSAGFHIHISFRPMIPPEIRSTKFTKFMLDAIKDKFPIEYRMRTATQWCRVTGLDSEDFINDPHDRYKAINYASFQKHGTLEFRIFPSRHPHRMYQYVCFIIKKVR